MEKKGRRQECPGGMATCRGGGKGQSTPPRITTYTRLSRTSFTSHGKDLKQAGASDFQFGGYGGYVYLMDRTGRAF